MLRVFKTAWFAKTARKARIKDEELCSIVLLVERGLVDNLGGGVYKKRLRKNEYRSIILSKAGEFWVYQFLFAKQDRANIESDELIEFRKLVKAYAGINRQQLALLIQNQDWVEICNDSQGKVQERRV